MSTPSVRPDRDVEGMICVSNITYSDGRWERPYYTRDQERARAYLEFLVTGGWRGLNVGRFTDGEWVDWADRVVIDGQGRDAKVSFREEN